MKQLYKYRHFGLIILLFFLFKDYFLPLYQKYIVEVFLRKFNQSAISDIIIGGCAILIIIWACQKIRNRFYFKPEFVVYSAIFFIVYIWVNKNYSDDLLNTHFSSNLFYADIIYLITIVPFVIKLGFWASSKDKRVIKSNLYNDSPISNPSDDILNRKQNALQVSRLIRNNKSESSLAVGIVGEWGNGKTSFMNFVEDSFKDDKDYIIVHFNSWLNISVHSIISDFFSTVEKKIRTHSVDISKDIKKYGNNVLSISKTSTAETLLNAVKIIPDSNLSDDFDNINQLLNKLDKKVIVFFDDLDRLQPNEVFEVLKLIRNTASFDVFNYVVGYDKDYLIKALEKNNIPYPEKYCEKIFLKEFPLPPIRTREINNFIKTGVQNIIEGNSKEVEEFFEYEESYRFYNNENLFESINNIRNAKRFLNEFIVSICMSSKESVLFLRECF